MRVSRYLLISCPEVQIAIIDPYFRKNKVDDKIALELLSNSKSPLAPTNINSTSCSFLNGQIKVHEEFFDEYLENISKTNT